MCCSFFSNNVLTLSNTIRQLWNQHGVWTRITINSLVFNTPDREANINRLLRNPLDFKDVFKQFYGEMIAERFSDLLTEHLVLAADLVNALVAGNQQLANQIRRDWYKNALKIAKFLSQINPFNSFFTWKEMMFEHLGLVEREAAELINAKYENSVEAYDEMEKQILQMADLMTNGLIKQFCII